MITAIQITDNIELLHFKTGNYALSISRLEDGFEDVWSYIVPIRQHNGQFSIDWQVGHKCVKLPLEQEIQILEFLTQYDNEQPF